KQWNLSSMFAAQLFTKAGCYLREQGLYSEAEAFLQQAYSIYQQLSKADQLEIASILNDLAELYRLQGKYTQAQPLYEDALRIREQLLAPNHPDVATSLHHLA